LRHIFTQRNLNAKQRRWSELMSEYDFGILYIKGKENVVVDALSRSISHGPNNMNIVPGVHVSEP
jgi:hypothetical protein